MKNNSNSKYNYRQDFPFFNNNDNLVFLDSAATSLKPKVVLEAIISYYEKYSINTHSTDYALASQAKENYESCRDTVAQFINCARNEVVFCSGTTFAFNQLAYSLEKFLQPGDEVVLTNCEHGSLLLPFYRLKAQKNIVLRFIDVNNDGLITKEKLQAVLNKKTRVVAFANMNNSLGTVNDVEGLTKIIKDFKLPQLDEKIWPFKEIFVAIDGAQSAVHVKSDVKKWNIDFFAFSGHKVFAPTGIGIWWAKSQWLNTFAPLIVGGGMNGRIYQDGTYTLLKPPYCFEAGTVNVAGVFGLKAALEYFLKIGIDTLYHHEKVLKQYAIKKFKAILQDKVTILNENEPVGTLLFNVNSAAAEDVATYLGSKNICLRSGTFCAKLITSVIGCASALRVSFLIYNNEEDIDRLVLALKQGIDQGGDFLNEFFETK